MAYMGRLCPKEVCFQASGIWKGREICHCGANRWRILWLWKSKKSILALWFIHILKTIHLQQLQGMQSSKLKGEGLPIFNFVEYSPPSPPPPGLIISFRELNLWLVLSCSMGIQKLTGTVNIFIVTVQLNHMNCYLDLSVLEFMFVSHLIPCVWRK